MKQGMRIALCVLALLSPAAWAQEAPPLDEPAPATELPAMPQAGAAPAQTPAQVQDNNLVALGQKAGIPALPPARPCNQTDILGIWRLANLYEVPAGAETAALASNPAQYYVFNRDSTYGRVNEATEIPPHMVRESLQSQNPGLRQFVVDQNGMLFFYQDGIAVDTMACFIVAETKAPFQHGQMLMLPPEGQAKSRLIKIFEKARRAAPGAMRPARRRSGRRNNPNNNLIPNQAGAQ